MSKKDKSKKTGITIMLPKVVHMCRERLSAQEMHTIDVLVFGLLDKIDELGVRCTPDVIEAIMIDVHEGLIRRKRK